MFFSVGIYTAYSFIKNTVCHNMSKVNYEFSGNAFIFSDNVL